MSSEDELLAAAIGKWEAAYRSRYALSTTAVTEVTATLADALKKAVKDNPGDMAAAINSALQTAQLHAAKLARKEYAERKRKRQERREVARDRSAPLGASISDRVKK